MTSTVKDIAYFYSSRLKNSWSVLPSSPPNAFQNITVFESRYLCGCAIWKFQKSKFELKKTMASSCLVWRITQHLIYIYIVCLRNYNNKVISLIIITSIYNQCWYLSNNNTTSRPIGWKYWWQYANGMTVNYNVSFRQSRFTLTGIIRFIREETSSYHILISLIGLPE